jgi:uncharacterized protein YdcH (DUF465 family)
MSHTPHELAEEFPDDAAVIHALKGEDAHFARLAEEYHQVNRLVHRIESEVEPSSDETLTQARRQRLHLKDEIAAIIAARRRAVA